MKPRLDRLATVKTVAQLGPFWGAPSRYEARQAVTPLDAASCTSKALVRLVEAELPHSGRGIPPQATYLFKHALIQEAAYQSFAEGTAPAGPSAFAQVLRAPGSPPPWRPNRS